MLNLENTANSRPAPAPDYEGLVRFLFEPLLESPELLSFDCERLKTTRRVWIRLAFAEREKGKIYGRGRRNIQAIKKILETAANSAGDTLYLEIHEDEEQPKLKSTREKDSVSGSANQRNLPALHARRPLRRRNSLKSRF